VRVLILGGYGVFGGRLARLLADEARLTLVIAGRSREKASAFCVALGGAGYAEGVTMGAQVGKQALAVLVTCLWSGGVTAVSLWLISKVTALRVDVEGETDGLDLTLHDERGYNL